MPNFLLFQRILQRLEGKLKRCGTISLSYSWIRLAVFLTGDAASLGTATFVGVLAG